MSASWLKEWAPTERSGEPASLEQAVGEAVGTASMCWDEVEKAGQFREEQAGWVRDGLVAWIRSHPEEVRSAGPLDLPSVEQQLRRDLVMRLGDSYGDSAALIAAASQLERYILTGESRPRGADLLTGDPVPAGGGRFA